MISFFPFIPQLPSAPFKIKSEVKRSFMAGFAASGIELITANNLMMYAKSRVQLNAPIDRQLVLETFRKGYRGIGVFWLQFGSGGGLSLATENKLRQIYREFHQPESMQANFAIRAVSAITVGALWNTPMENIALRCQLTSESFGSIVRRVVYPKIDEERFQLYRGLFPIVFRQATIMPFLLMGPELFTKLPKHVQSNDAAFPLLNFFIGGAG
ncbi:MAG: hypothetical protein VW397_09390, partial [Candidatus Margulisiibacteriota bacterium]